MFIDRLEVHNNTMVKNTTYLAHTHYIMYTVMLKYINVQIYKKIYKNTAGCMIIPTHMCT